MKMENSYSPVAIIGMGCVYPPNLFSVDDLWKGIMSGSKGVDVVSDNIWDKQLYYDSDRNAEDKTYCDKSGFLKQWPENFNELILKFSLDENKVYQLNRTQKLLLYSILQSVDSASLKLADLQKSSMVLGNMLGDVSFSNYLMSCRSKNFLEKINKRKGVFSEDELLNMYSELEKRFKYNDVSLKNLFPSGLLKGLTDILKCDGYSFMVDGACSGSILAIDESIKLLHNGDSKLSVVSGALGNIGVTGNVAFSKIGALAGSEARPLDNKADGLIPGEGYATLILKDLNEAIKDKNNIFAVIKGTGVASDGKGKAIYAPSSNGECLAMKKALSRSKKSMRDIDYVEMHATGTPVGDKTELNSILSLVKESDRSKKLNIGSIKHQIGHSFSAAGMAGILKVVMGFNNGVIPPTYGFEKFPDEFSKDHTNLRVVTNPRKWETDNPCAIVNAFGFGGIDASIVIQKYDKSILPKERPASKKIDFSVVGLGFNSEKFENLELLKENVVDTKDFPFLKYHMPPKVVSKIDDSQKMALIAASEAVGNAKEDLEGINPERIGLFVSGMQGLSLGFKYDERTRSSELENILEIKTTLSKQVIKNIISEYKSNFEELSEDSLPGFMDNVISGRVANNNDIQGCNLVIDSMDNSFFITLKQGLLSLMNKEYDAVIIGAVHANLDDEYVELYEKAYDKKVSLDDKEAIFFVVKRNDEAKKSISYFKVDTVGSLRKGESKNYLGLTGAKEFLNCILSNKKEDLYSEPIGSKTIRISFDNTGRQRVACFDTLEIKQIKSDLEDLERLEKVGPNTKLVITYKNKADLFDKVKFIEKWRNLND